MPVIKLNIEYNDLIRFYREDEENNSIQLVEDFSGIPYTEHLDFVSPINVTFILDSQKEVYGISNGPRYLFYEGNVYQFILNDDSKEIQTELDFSYVSRDDLELGDIIFKTTTPAPTVELDNNTNYGIFIGNNEFIRFTLKGDFTIERLTINDYIWRFEEEEIEEEEPEVFEGDLEEELDVNGDVIVEEDVIEDDDIIIADEDIDVDFS